MTSFGRWGPLDSRRDGQGVRDWRGADGGGILESDVCPGYRVSRGTNLVSGCWTQEGTLEAGAGGRTVEVGRRERKGRVNQWWKSVSPSPKEYTTPVT